MFRSISALTLALGLCACANMSAPGAVTTAPASRVTGTVSYRERIALPPNALVTVRLVDVSRADAASVTLGEQIIQADGRQPPFAFDIAYDPARIDERFSYAVQARIEVDGKLRFISDQRYAVITGGAPRHVDLVLKTVGTPAPQ